MPTVAQKHLILTSAVAILFLTTLFLAAVAQSNRYLRTQALVGDTSGIVAGKVLIRLNTTQAKALRSALTQAAQTVPSAPTPPPLQSLAPAPSAPSGRAPFRPLAAQSFAQLNTPTATSSAMPVASIVPPASPALQAVPGLSILGNTLKNVAPVIPLVNIPSDLPAIDRWFVIELTSNTTAATQAALQQLSMAGFEKAEPVRVGELAAVPNDPYYSSSGTWGQSYEDLWGLKKIQAQGAWDVTTGSASTIVAVLDTGLDFSHPDIQGNTWENRGETGQDAAGADKESNQRDDDLNGYVDDWQGYDFSGDTVDEVIPDNDPTDSSNGHGTHVAGIIAARGNNGQGIPGVMWQAQVMTLKIFPNPADYVAAAALKYAADHGARVANTSWSMRGAVPQLVADAISYVKTKNMLVVASTGNNGQVSESHNYPVGFNDVLGVGASTPLDQRASFSTYGNYVDVVAPGGSDGVEPGCGDGVFSNMLSLRARNSHLTTCVSVSGGSLERRYGTSFAAPHVTGLAGLLFSAHPTWTVKQVHDRIIATADDLGTPGFDSETGYGRINAARALGNPAPPPAPCLGDYNGNGTVDTADHVFWRNTLGQTVPAGTGADGNSNGIVDQADYTIWRANFGKTCGTATGASLPEEQTPIALPASGAEAPGEGGPPLAPAPPAGGPAPVACTLPGDYNKDRKVDTADYVVWRKNNGKRGTNPADGDGNKVVNQKDYYLWLANFGQTCS